MICEPLLSVLLTFVAAFWIMVPAYVANAGAVPFGGGKPVDFGKCARDGHRYLGDGKTWRGFIDGVVVGILFGGLQIFLVDIFHWDWLPQHTLVTIIALAVGALLGDMVKSFFKRRVGKDRGQKWPVADMYDLVAGSLVLMALFAWQWVMEYITIWIFLAILIWTPLLHRGANIVGYLIGIKQVPW